MESDEVTARLEVRGVDKSYGAREVLHGINASFGPGVTALLGRNGAGKSTLMRILAGVESPTAGATHLRERAGELTDRDRHRRVGWLPQRFGFPGRMRVADFLAYAAWLKGLSRSAAVRAAVPAMELVDVAAQADQRLGTLSGGTIRRVGLAAAIVHDPAVLLLDEPTTGLDPIQRSRFHTRIAALAHDRTVILATHILEDVARLAGSVTVIDEGRTVWAGSGAQLIERAGPGLGHVEAIRSSMIDLVGDEFE